MRKAGIFLFALCAFAFINANATQKVECEQSDECHCTCSASPCNVAYTKNGVTTCSNSGGTCYTIEGEKICGTTDF